MTTELCRRELLRRSALLTGAGAIALGGFAGTTQAAGATASQKPTTKWAIPPLPGIGEILGAHALVDRSTVVAALALPGGAVTVFSIPVGGSSWTEQFVTADVASGARTFTAVGGYLVLAGGRLQKLGERRVQMGIDSKGQQVAPPTSIKSPEEAVSFDTGEIVVEDWTSVAFVATSSDGGATWKSTTGPSTAPNSWISEAVPMPGSGTLVGLFGSSNDEPGLQEGYESVASTFDLRTGAIKSLPLPPRLAEGSWNCSASSRSELVLGARDHEGAKLVRFTGKGWSNVQLPASAQFSPVALSVADASLVLAGVDLDGRPLLWRGKSLTKPAWSASAVPIGVTVGTHPRSIVSIAQSDLTLVSTSKGAPVVAKEGI